MANKSTKLNMQRKSFFIDKVSFYNGKPIFSFIDINPTELCNRTCVFCPRHDPKEYPNQNLHMDIDTAHKIREELEKLNWNGSINICGNGEPLLHKDIVGLVGALGDKIHVEITTNGDFLTVDLIKDFYKNHLNYIVVSMYDGPEQIEHFNNLFSKSGIDEDLYILRDRWYGEDEEYGLILTNRVGSLDFNKKVKVGKQCFYMHYSLQMDWNGDILSCCHDLYAKTRTFGNVNNKTLLEIWNSSMWNKSRKLLGEGKRIESPCNNCNAGGTLHGHNHYSEWNKEDLNLYPWKSRFVNEWAEGGGKRYDEPTDGLFQIHWPNGNLRYEWYYKDGKRADGVSMGWYETGELKQTMSWKNGIRHGLWITYYKNGEKRREGTFTNGELSGVINTPQGEVL